MAAVIALFRGLAVLCGLVVLPSAVFGHRLDEYLQGTIVDLEPGGIRLRIQLTPGVAISEQVLHQIDRDRDGVISKKEAAGYSDLLRRDLRARLDRREVKLKLTASNFPAPAELRTGTGIIQIEFSVTPGRLAAGTHRFALENRHLPAISVYLFNAAQPKSDAIRINTQKRNENQSVGEIEFTIQPSSREHGRQ